MNCREWEEAIALYAGGDLDGRAQRAPRLDVERHLAGCAGCQMFASGMLECLEEMRAGHREEIAAAHFAAVRARVLTKLQPAPWWRRRWLRVAAIAALACCALWLELAIERIHRPVPPPQVALAHPPAPPLAVPAVAMPARAVTRAVLPRAIRNPGLPPLPRQPAPPEEQLIVRIVTDDADVVIYWIANPKGE
ncbi:MAG: hypothetical protein ACLQU1_17135 [Bryobacteraceae bacterium]